MTQKKFGPYAFESSREDKVFFPEAHITKGDVIAYYEKIAEFMLPHLKDRPLILRRFPDGIEAEGFFQQKAAAYFPEWLPRITMTKADGKIMHPAAEKKADLVYLANQGVIVFHALLSRIDQPKTPDQVVFDLDPPPADSFNVVRKAALDLRDLLDELGLAAFVKTSGSRGLHVVCPIRRNHRFERTRRFAGEVARYLAAKNPDRITTAQAKDRRKGRLFMDTARNAYGQSMVAPYALRAQSGAPVATPLEWQEVKQKSLTPDRYKISNIFKRLAQKRDPWQAMRRRARGLTGPQKRLQALVSKGEH
jgi:bifunctional non-homologous end joining protein LigD